MRFTTGDIVSVIWLDAEQASRWISQEDAATKPNATFRSIGFFNGVDGDYIYLSDTIGIDGNTDRTKWSIPTGSIKKIELVKPRKGWRAVTETKKGREER